VSDLICPRCRGQLRCVDSSGVWWRCHLDHAYDLSNSTEAKQQADMLNALSASNAAAIHAGRSA